MSSLDAILVYGVDFYDTDETHVRGTEDPGDRYASFEAPWYSGDREVGMFYDQATRKLYESIPDAPATDCDYAREKVVRERLGVWFESYGSGDWNGYALVCHRGGESDDYSPGEPIDLHALVEESVEDANGAKISRALEILGVTPKKREPGWIILPRSDD